MNLLITGGAGFIGSNVIQHIIDQPEISKLINLDSLTYAGHLANLSNLCSHPKYIFEKVDLRDRQALSQVFQKHNISRILHLAAESHVDRSISGPGEFITTNIIGTFNLLECCREFWTLGQPLSHRFHHVSTDEVYGSLGTSGRFTESSPYAPNSPYSASKASSDLLVRAYHHTYGLNTVITNCSNNYGPYQFPEKLIPVVIRNLMLRKQIPVYGDGLNVRDWLYVRDHAEALWQVFNRGVSGDTYNIGGHNEWANINIVKLMCDIFDELRPVAGGNSQNLITYVKDRPGHDRRYAIDAGKIKRELGWKPAYTFEIGIRETIRWYLDNQTWIETVLNEQRNN
jgi:dTDP-glucose 4,6-dehydratase